LKKIESDTNEPKDENPELSVTEIENSSAKLFEEIKVMFQDLPSRIDKTSRNSINRRRFRLHPKMIEELIHISPNPKVGLKIALSFYREKFPWIYDEGLVIINKGFSNKSESSSQRILKEFDELLRISLRHPFLEELFLDNEEEYMLFKELPHTILRGLERLLMNYKGD
jgi:hypothetical protein